MRRIPQIFLSYLQYMLLGSENSIINIQKCLAQLSPGGVPAFFLILLPQEYLSIVETEDIYCKISAEKKILSYYFFETLASNPFLYKLEPGSYQLHESIHYIQGHSKCLQNFSSQEMEIPIPLLKLTTHLSIIPQSTMEWNDFFFFFGQTQKFLS